MTIISTTLRCGLAALAIALTPQLAQSQTAPAANVRVAAMGVANFTPLVVARDKGFFKEQNLNVTWTSIAQGAIGVEAVFGGSAEFAAASIFEPMVARSNGLDIVYVAASNANAELIRSGCTTHVEMSATQRQFEAYVRIARRWGVRGYPV